MPRRFEGLTGQAKKVAGLQSRRNRERYGQILVEGPQAVREVLARPELRDLYVTEEGLARHPDLDSLAQRVDPYTHVLSEADFARLSTSAQGWLAVADVPGQPSLADVLGRAPRLLVCLAESADPGNLGTVIRTADAAGADAVLLGPGSVELFNPKVIRSSAGSVFHLPILSVAVQEAVGAARAAGIQVLCADGSGERDLAQAMVCPGDFSRVDGAGSQVLDLASPTMWLVGNEAHGFTPAQLELADHRVRIPMWGAAESLNAGVASSLCLYASALAQRAAEAR
ncbi:MULTISPECIES: TrmH family RNA methyltransferase [Trueperella]|uniref:23S rRNA (Uridine(2479)-2'-O)-methyltransferase n=1 Tax=Trueperella bernardiae TaxID=59561 RepID=A0A0W1KIP8_9ACTO|nr:MULTISPECIES: RNA methyltransferase [Trueperella]KTF03953.1 23S rRNA (uridine(2479)-2'-O)-methyltransferase [Trueperella bernardiae]MCM3907739.1 RNA methyltransferase [Trueperella bernardiae]MDK8602457.1 RNA methyltransferase [Trueperella bernardiae]MDV6238252.1 RNA methyltransferase [Trueperella bernardiae]OCW60145.1 hypothetical protein AKG36_06600 [Trueperella bernardiae]